MGSHDWRQLYADELPDEAHVDPQTFYEEGPNAGKVAPDSLKVGWSLRDANGKITAAFAFLINPQGLTRAQGTRSQLFATKSAFYVDDFGPAAGVIQLRQLVAHGKTFTGGFYTAREDVQRFLQTIYLPATRGNRGATRVWFHDHHFDRGYEEEVFFPDQSLTLERSVDLHNVWRLDLQMISLQKQPLGQATAEKTPDRRHARKYLVRRGDTVEKLARRLAGRHPTSAKIAQARELLVALNPKLKHKRTLSNGHVAKPMRVYPGETVLLPA